MMFDGPGRRRVGAERDVEPDELAKQDDEILHGAMMLLAGQMLALFDQRACAGEIRGVLEQESAEPFTRRVESRRVVEPPGEVENLLERDTHRHVPHFECVGRTGYCATRLVNTGAPEGA